MVAISQSEGFPRPISQPVTPRKGDIGRLLKQFNLEYDLNLPWNDRESPSKKRRSPGHEVASAISFLYFKDSPALDRAVDDFAHCLPKLGSDDKKVEYLLERLTIAKTECLKAGTPRGSSRRSTRHSPIDRQSTRSADLPEPASPTPSIRHAPNSSVEMPADDFQLPPARSFRKPSLKRPLSHQSLTEKMRASSSRTPHVQGQPEDAAVPCLERGGRDLGNTSALFDNVMPPPTEPSSAQRRGDTSVNTSFTSNGLTSMNTSFWSDAQQGTQDFGSPATSVDESFHTPDDKGESFGLDGANDLTQSYYGSFPNMEDLGPAQSEQRRPRPLPDLRQSTQSQSTQSDFGGSIDPQVVDELMFNAIKGQPTKSNEQLASPPKTDSQPGPHELTGRDRVKQISHDGLTSLLTPHWLLMLPFDLRLEAIRVLQKSQMTCEDFNVAWAPPRTVESLHELVGRKGIKYERGCKTDLAECGLAAEFRWCPKSYGRVFDLQLCPPRTDDSNPLERKFGRDRFLVVDIHRPSRPPKDSDLENFGSMVLEQVREMLKQEQQFAGRIWRQFLVQPKRQRRTTRKADTRGTLQVTFFAVRSEDGTSDPLQSIKISQVLDWAVQFAENAGSPHCKMYSRLDLAASRTTPTITFRRSEIVYDCLDQMPTADPENNEFHDDALVPNNAPSGEAMSDGCSKISTWAMREIQRKLGLPHLPSVVQGRIFGAKGIWYRDDDDASLHQKPEKLIWISNSQIKVRQREKEFYDDHKVTFNVVQMNGPAYPSFLYADFLPILVDRKVPRPAIEQVVKEGAKAIVDDFIQAFPNAIDLGEWINRQSNIRDTRTRNSGIDAVGGFPVSGEEQVLRMLVSGFQSTSCRHLATETKRIFEQYLDWIRKNFKTQLRNSTMLIGIADPLGVLKPGEIHVGFSRPFEDATGTRYNLGKLEALVSRLPSLGASDMQRVRCVFNKDLSHLTDVVVFPSRGPRSLASKLQGGDYDGDTFVIIWEEPLVQHFRNAPVPIAVDGPSKFDIEVDTRKMGEFVQEYFSGAFNEQQVLHWINLHTEKRMRPDPLGQITLLYEKIVYHDNSLNTHRARQTLRLHDLIIDAAKQGYYLPPAALDKFKKRHGLFKVEEKGDPAHRKFTKGTRAVRQQTSLAQAKQTHNISDYIYFEVVDKALNKALDQTKSIADTTTDSDADIEAPFFQELTAAKRGSAAHNELVRLQAQLSKLKDLWNESTSRYNKEKHKPWHAIVEDIRAGYENIMPLETTSSETVQFWLKRSGAEPSWWEKLRASALVFTGATSKLMFCAAGAELCYLKVYATGRAVPVSELGYWNMELRKRKRKAEVLVEDEEDEAGDEGGDAAKSR